ncbi:MAG: hypothetical protein WAX67_10475, partial [Rugosibacter sp.]
MMLIHIHGIPSTAKTAVLGRSGRRCPEPMMMPLSQPCRGPVAILYRAPLAKGKAFRPRCFVAIRALRLLSTPRNADACALSLASQTAHRCRSAKGKTGKTKGKGKCKTVFSSSRKTIHFASPFGEVNPDFRSRQSQSGRAAGKSSTPSRQPGTGVHNSSSGQKQPARTVTKLPGNRRSVTPSCNPLNALPDW